MRVDRLPDVGEFLSQTKALRAREPVLTNVIGSVAEGVAAGRAYQECFWWVVRGDHGETAGCAMRTTPWKLIVSPMAGEAATALGTALAEADLVGPGVVGPPEVVAAVVQALAAAGRPAESRIAMADVVLVLDAYHPPPAVSGAARRATADELDVLVAWQLAFAQEAGVPSHDTAASVLSRLQQASIWWWEVDGERVAMAGHAVPVPTPAGSVGRVGPVYTPPRFRRRGYGAAVTAAVVEHLLPICGTVMLFADAANPTSNAVYERLGFRPTGRVLDVDLVGAARG